MSSAAWKSAVTINATGSYTYVINNADPEIDQLNSGGPLPYSFSYQVSGDARGLHSFPTRRSSDLVNHAPVAVVDAGSATEAGITAGSNATGNVLTNDTDVDNTNEIVSAND